MNLKQAYKVAVVRRDSKGTGSDGMKNGQPTATCRKDKRELSAHRAKS